MKYLVGRLKRYPILYFQLKKLYEHFNPPLAKRLEKFFSNKDDIFFIQVGSNDGKLGDPIHRLVVSNNTWRGIFIEPVPYLFQKLKLTYKNSSRFIFENVAISSESRRQKFFYIQELDKVNLNLPEWIDQLGSFDKKHILKHIAEFDIEHLEKYIIEDIIDCATFEEICRRNEVHKIDLLHIDAEGYDFKVLSQVDFCKYKPLVVLFENKHLQEDEVIQAECLLKDKGYEWISLKGDHLCFRKTSR
jgi:FkbM family methyltransferase